MNRIILLFLLLPSLASAEIYKWKDSKGQVHFSDAPVNTNEAEKVSVEVNTYEHVVPKDVFKSTASSSQRVVMYATSWCPYCEKARKYFKANKISYTEYDIENDTNAKIRYDSIGGKGVPVILVGKRRLNGFSESGFKRIFKE